MAHSGPSADEATTLPDVLGLVLQHSDLLQPAPLGRHAVCVRDFCRLLETSKAAAAAVQAVPGRLDMEIDSRTKQEVEATAQWLACHGQSIGFLQLSTNYFGCVDDDDDDEEEEEDKEEQEEDPAVRDQRLAAAEEGRAAADAALVAALQQAAAAAAPGLQLRRLDIGMHPSTTLQLLQLAGKQLTRLQLWSYSHEVEPVAAHLAAAVAALPRLEQLELSEGTEQVLAGLSGSSGITQLRLRLPCSLSLLAGLPCQLQELVMDLAPEGRRQNGRSALQLRHCTTLTRLDISCTSLEAQDELPDSLVELAVGGCSSCEPLLGLKQLRELRSYTPTAELRRLSQLSSLSCIKLSFVDVESMAASAEDWPVLPGLLELDLRMWRSGPVDCWVSVMRHLSKATRVQKLWVSDLGMDKVALVSQPLAAALPALTQLRDFKFSVWDDRDKADWDEPSPVLEAGVMALAAAIAGLPRLQDLSLCGLPWNLVAPPFAAAGTQLTNLALHNGTEVLDVDLSRVFCGLTRLRSLELGHEWSTDDALVAAADHLQQLTRLAVCLSPALRLSVAGLQQLARMPRLQRFEVNRFFEIGYSCRCEQNFRAADVRAALVAAGGGCESLQIVIEGPP